MSSVRDFRFLHSYFLYGSLDKTFVPRAIKSIPQLICRSLLQYL
jgi:hypothetical protein